MFIKFILITFHFSFINRFIILQNMSPRRQVRAVANPKVKGVTSKCPVAENNSSVSRTRSGRQVDKSIPELPRKLTKSAPPSPSKHHPPRPISSPSSRSLPKPETPKRTLQRSTRNSPVPNSASAKKTPSKLSSKISSSDTILKKKSHQTTTSLGINVKTTPKKVPLKTAVPEKKLKTTPKKAPPKSTTLPENNVKTTLKKTPLKVNTSSANNVKTTPKKVLPKTITSSEKNVKITPKKVPLKNTSAENNVQTTPKKGSSKTPVSNNGLRSPTRQMSTRGSPQSKVLLLTFSPKKVVGHASPAKSPNRSLKSASKPTVSSPVSPNRLTRKRLLSSPSKSPVAAKRRLRGDNVLIPLQMKSELVSDDDCVVLDGVLKDGPQSTLERGEINPSALFHASKQNKITSLKKTGAALPSDPELSGRFLRRKWFSLKVLSLSAFLLSKSSVNWSSFVYGLMI